VVGLVPADRFFASARLTSSPPSHGPTARECLTNFGNSRTKNPPAVPPQKELSGWTPTTVPRVWFKGAGLWFDFQKLFGSALLSREIRNPRLPGRHTSSTTPNKTWVKNSNERKGYMCAPSVPDLRDSAPQSFLFSSSETTAPPPFNHFVSGGGGFSHTSFLF